MTALVQLKYVAPSAGDHDTDAVGREEVPVPVAARLSGRSAYVCIDRTCLARARSNMIARAVRGPVAALDGPMLQRALQDLARGRLLALLGLARRCGDLVVGVDAVAGEAAAREESVSWFSVVAADAAPRSARKLLTASSAHIFLSSLELGAAIGQGAVAAVGIRSGRLAMQAAYWFRVWYETQSREQLAEDLATAQAASGYQQQGSGQGTPTRD